MMLGREINMPADIMFPQARETYDDPDSFVSKLAAQMKTAHEVARNSLKSATKRMKRNYDLRILHRNYSKGDLVYLLDTAVLKGKCKKLSPPWKGPGVITKKLSDYLFKIRLRNSAMTVNHDRIKPCKDSNLPAWIKKFKEGGEVEEEDETLYCYCQKKWEGRFMIACDYCDKWYHGACVNVTASEATNIDKYKCPTCLTNP